MDQTLIDQIVTRVAEKLAQTERQECAGEGGKKPGLLILTQEHGDRCHSMLESNRLRQCYTTACALQQDNQCDVADYDAVILYGLTNEALAKIATGVCDTPYTRMASRAMLLGKRIFIPREEVELYRYASTAPAVYYSVLEEKLKILTASGAVICPNGELEDTILGVELSRAPEQKCPDHPDTAGGTAKPPIEQRLTKRVITERDLIACNEGKVTRVCIGEKAILTDLARELAKARGIEIVRA